MFAHKEHRQACGQCRQNPQACVDQKALNRMAVLNEVDPQLTSDRYYLDYYYAKS